MADHQDPDVRPLVNSEPAPRFTGDYQRRLIGAERLLLWSGLGAAIGVHFALILGAAVASPAMIFWAPWYVTCLVLPLAINLFLGRGGAECPVLRVENH